MVFQKKKPMFRVEQIPHGSGQRKEFLAAIKRRQSNNQISQERFKYENAGKHTKSGKYIPFSSYGYQAEKDAQYKSAGKRYEERESQKIKNAARIQTAKKIGSGLVSFGKGIGGFLGSVYREQRSYRAPRARAPVPYYKVVEAQNRLIMARQKRVELLRQVEFQRKQMKRRF